MQQQADKGTKAVVVNTSVPCSSSQEMRLPATYSYPIINLQDRRYRRYYILYNKTNDHEKSTYSIPFHAIMNKSWIMDCPRSRLNACNNTHIDPRSPADHPNPHGPTCIPSRIPVHHETRQEPSQIRCSLLYIQYTLHMEYGVTTDKTIIIPSIGIPGNSRAAFYTFLVPLRKADWIIYGNTTVVRSTWDAMLYSISWSTSGISKQELMISNACVYLLRSTKGYQDDFPFIQYSLYVSSPFLQDLPINDMGPSFDG
jgi:hypothetical protein